MRDYSLLYFFVIFDKGWVAFKNVTEDAQAFQDNCWGIRLPKTKAEIMRVARVRIQASTETPLINFGLAVWMTTLAEGDSGGICATTALRPMPAISLSSLFFSCNRKSLSAVTISPNWGSLILEMRGSKL